ncbi:MAG: hypothetical protein M1830_009796 [Pleopsidium flavum]|nr:MAG: hypothetical protein M1830_009796 [Pleopsidium flavum]
MNLRTLNWLGDGLKMVFFNTCKLNTIPECLPTLLKSYLEIVRQHHFDTPGIDAEALKWIEMQSREAWSEPYKHNQKPEFLDDITKVAMKHLCIVSFHDANDDFHPGSTAHTVEAHQDDSAGDLSLRKSSNQPSQLIQMPKTFRPAVEPALAEGLITVLTKFSLAKFSESTRLEKKPRTQVVAMEPRDSVKADKTAETEAKRPASSPNYGR